MKINKISTGFVIQTYDTELHQWTEQEFVAGAHTDYEEAGTGQTRAPADTRPIGQFFGGSFPASFALVK